MEEEFSNFVIAERAAKLFNNSLLSDGILIAGKGTNEKRFHIHSLILKITSPVFESMLQDGKELRVPNIIPSAMEAVLKYIYMNKLPEISSDDAIATYEAAKYFHLAHLKDLCCNYMCNIISSNNAIKFYEFAFQNGIPSLLSKSAVLLFKETETVLKNSEFTDVSQNTILNIVKNASSVNEKQLMKSVIEWAIEKNDKFEKLLKPFIPHFRLNTADMMMIITESFLTSEKSYNLDKLALPDSSYYKTLQARRESVIPLNFHFKTFNVLRSLKNNDIFTVTFFTEYDCFIEAIALPIISKMKTFYTMNFEINYTDLKSKNNYLLPSSPRIFLQCEPNKLSKFRLHFPLYVRKRNPVMLKIVNLEELQSLSIIRHQKITGQFEWHGKSIAYVPNYNSDEDHFQISGLLFYFSNL